MADATFNDVLGEQKKTNELLLKQQKDALSKDLLDSQKEIIKAVKEGPQETASDIVKGSLPEVLATYDTYNRQKAYKTDPETPGMDDDQWKKQHGNIDKILKASKGPYEALEDLAPATLALTDDRLSQIGPDLEDPRIKETWLDHLKRTLFQLTLIGKSTKTPSQEEEEEKDKKSFMSKTFDKLLKGMGELFIKTPLKVVAAGFSALLAAGGLLALSAFLRSSWFEKLRVWLLTEAVPAIEFLYNKVLVPLGKWLWGSIKNFLIDLAAFLEKKDWDTLIELIGDNKLVLTLLAATFLPLGGIGIAIVAFSKAWGLLATAITKGAGLLPAALPIVGYVALAAVVAAAALVWWKAFWKGKAEFDEAKDAGKSDWEAFKDAYMEFSNSLFTIPYEWMRKFFGGDEWRTGEELLKTLAIKEQEWIEHWKTLPLFPMISEMSSWNDLKVQWEKDIDKLIGYWDGILGLLQSGWEKIARVLLGIDDEPEIKIDPPTEAEQARIDKYDPKPKTMLNPDRTMEAAALEIGVEWDLKAKEALKAAYPKGLPRGFRGDFYQLFGASDKYTPRGEKLNQAQLDLLKAEREAKRNAETLKQSSLDLGSRSNGNNAGQNLSVVTDSSVNQVANNSYRGPTSIVDLNMMTAPHIVGVA